VPLEEKLSMLQAAAHYLNSFGITSVVNATGDLAELELYAALRDRGTLTVRTRTSFGSVAVQHHLTPAFLTELEQARRLYHDDWVSANLVKFFADGASGVIPPLVYDAHDYEAMVMELDSRGYQIMTHALRTDSVHMILDTYERLQQAHGPRDRRLRIEHADLIDAVDIPRFARLKVVADMQPSFCCGEDGGGTDPAEQVPADRWHTCSKAARCWHSAATGHAPGPRPVRLDSTDGDAARRGSPPTPPTWRAKPGWRRPGRRHRDRRDLRPGERISVADAVRALAAGLGVCRLRG
jgi:predicted amidohydrolase YtcJ